MKKLYLILCFFVLFICASCDNDNEEILGESPESKTVETSTNDNNDKEKEESKEEQKTVDNSNDDEKKVNDGSSNYENPYEDEDTWHRIA